MLSAGYFEIAFNMKEQLCRSNSILIVIGYSGNDEHINRILQDCLNTGLTIYWYKYSESDAVPFSESNQVIIRTQKSKNDHIDSTKMFFDDMEKIWEVLVVLR